MQNDLYEINLVKIEVRDLQGERQDSKNLSPLNIQLKVFDNSIVICNPIFLSYIFIDSNR